MEGWELEGIFSSCGLVCQRPQRDPRYAVGHGCVVAWQVWSLGGSLIAESRKRFDAIIKNISQLPVIESDSVPCGPSQLPAVQPTLYEYRYSYGLYDMAYSSHGPAVQPTL